ncbi:hypothetical protein ES705_13915 [subsurface metagenome]
MRKILLIMVFAGILVNSRAQNCDTNLFPDGQQYYDTYHEFAGNPSTWQHFNTHDPTVYKDGEWFYMYSTDASWGNIHNTGALKRRSKDLVNWEFLGNAFDGVPQSAVDFFINNGNPSYTDDGIWAPFLHKFKDKFYLYYSAPGGLVNQNFAFLGYAVSDSASGPWVDQGMITTSSPGDNINAIDPTVVFDSISQKLWMAYGSWHSGLYILELDTATGGLKTPGDRGVRVAARNGGLEGPEITYRNGWYYLFVSYDPLGDLYNVRVGRSTNPNGPYYDFNGVNMADYTDNIPMIQAPYKFNYHPGWQGTGHCGVYSDNGTYYMFNQSRPSIEPAMMVLHARKIFWIDDWPVVSPERYAGVPQCAITSDSLLGEWEHLILTYKTGGNYHSTSTPLELHTDGTFNSNTANIWTLDKDTLLLSWDSGNSIDKLIVFWGWDWENSCKTLLYTGMNEDGVCSWGKKMNQQAVDRYNSIVPGAVYKIRSAFSNMLMEVPNGGDSDGLSIKQGADKKEAYQLWRIQDAGSGYYKFKSYASDSGRVIEVAAGADNNGIDLQLWRNEGLDKQKFRISTDFNGFYHITTKVSKGFRCVDVAGFSVAQGGNIFQWQYLYGLNQTWRFIRIDTIAIDTTDIIYPPVNPPVSNAELLSGDENFIQVYPNPSKDGNVTITLSPNQEREYLIRIYNLYGRLIYNDVIPANSGNYQVVMPEIEKGFYILKIRSKHHEVNKVLVIN